VLLERPSRRARTLRSLVRTRRRICAEQKYLIRMSNVRIIALLVLLVLSSGAIPLFPVTAASPANALVSITLTNSQSTSTSVPFQQRITFNPSTYSSNEASDLGNIRFCSDSACATQLNAWLESCSPTCGTSATSATAWVKLDSSIPSNGGTLTIYMNFLSTSTDFDGLYWGEAPTLSATYGQHDNGAMVFPILYQNFGGSSCPSGWLCTNAKINNGIALPSNSSAVSTSAYGRNPAQILDFDATSLVASISNQGPSFAGYTNAPPPTTNAVNSQNSVGFLGGIYGNNNYTGSITVNGAARGSSVALKASGGIGTVYFPSSSTASFSANYSQLVTLTSATPTSNLSIGFSDEQGGANYAGTQNYQWIRLRVYPPNGVMPSQTTSSTTVSTTPEFPTVMVAFILLAALVCSAVFTKRIKLQNRGQNYSVHFCKPILRLC